MKKVIVLLAVLAISANAFALGIAGTAHDFNAASWNTGDEICQPCHVPHNPTNVSTAAPLWNHTITAKTYDAGTELYDSGTFDATDIAAPSGVSQLCLSCHDGTISLDQWGGAVATSNFATKQVNDLTASHPISFTYDATLVTNDGGLVAHDDAAVAPLLFNNKVECSSCHDVHNSANQTSLLVKSNSTSELCLTCHAK